jgi:hypothetical protein
VRGSPFGSLGDNESYYSPGYAQFTLDKYCDGYVFQGGLEDSKGVSVDPMFITDANRKSFRARHCLEDRRIMTLTSPACFKKPYLTTISQIPESIRCDAQPCTISQRRDDQI